MELLGYIVAFFIGVSLGLVGAGGSILTVPLMVYLFGVPFLEATSYSLFIVGITSLIGTVYQSRQFAINGRVAVLLSLLSLTMVFLIRHYVLPQIPSQLFVMYEVPVTASMVAMLLFAILMLIAARAMMGPRRAEESEFQSSRSFPRLVGSGILVGLVTGFLGAGGGFILIPALVFLLRMPMKNAIGTSLLIIALNSLVGFALDLDHIVMDWYLLGVVTLIATGGVFLGVAIGRLMPAQHLKGFFGGFILVVGIVILVKEVAAFILKM